jgi:uncharacterized protein YcfJ
MKKFITIGVVSIITFFIVNNANARYIDNNWIEPKKHWDPASAFYDNNNSITETRGIVTDHYKFVPKRVPYNIEVCKNVYGHGHYNNTADILGGAIIGGIIGNQIGDSEGNGAVGAILGGLIGSQANPHYKSSHQRCTTEVRYKTVPGKVKEYTHSSMTFNIDGKNYTLTFIK